MRKRIGILFIALVLALTSGFALACSEVKVTPKNDKTYSVTYYYNYDDAPNSGVYRTDKVNENTAAKKPSNPTRTDYTFTDWTTDAAGSLSYNFSTLVTADLKLYAQYKQNDPAAELVSIDASITKQYKVGDAFNKSDITVTAKYTDGSERPVTDFTYSPNPDMSTAGQKTITVSYDGKTKDVSFTVRENDPVRTLLYIDIVRPTKRIYTVGEELDLNGLTVTAVYTDESEQNIDVDDCEVTGFDHDVLGDQIITVTYGGKFKTFAVTVAHLEGMQIITRPDTTDYGVGDKLDLTGIVVTADYSNGETIIYTEYLTEGDFDVEGFDSSEEGECLVTISYKGKEDSFTVTVTQAERTVEFVTGIAGMENPAAQTVDKYATITEPDGDFERVGYTFDGWFKDGATEAYDFDAEVTEYFTLTAKWTAIEYDINYIIENDEYGDSYATAPEKVTYTIEDAVDLLDPTGIKDGYTFIGWYDESGADEEGNLVYDNAHKVTGIELGSTGEKTFYARIAAINTFTVTFNYNYDETPITKTANVQEGTVATALNPAPTRTGYTFGGWFTDADGTDVWDFDVDTVTEDVTLYAKWNIAVYTVTFDPADGTMPEEALTQQVEYNKLAVKPANPTRDYPYTFGGWTLYGNAFDFNTPITGDVTLVANWWYDVQQGAFLHIRANGSSAWKDDYGASNHNEDSEWKIADVSLQVGSEFLVVEHGDGWDNWYNAQDGFTSWTSSDIITVVYSDGNFKVTKIGSGYTKVTWTIYIKKDGWGISLVPRNANEKRSPAVTNNVDWTFSEDRPNDKIFIAGTFTDGFKYHKQWSTESTAIKVLESWGTYTFRRVYLKKNDAFKIVNNGVWLSGNFEALDQEFWINDGHSEDITLMSINSGWYDIIYNTYDSTLRIKKYAEATITGLEVELRNPDKIYKVGDKVVSGDLYVRTVNSDGVKALVSGYVINAPDMSTPGEKWFSVSYGGVEGWVMINVRNAKTGAFLYVLTDIAADKWEEKYTVYWQNGDYGEEWKVTGVKLQAGTKFLVVDYGDTYTDWYNAAGEIVQYGYNDKITIKADGGNFKVEWIDGAYANALWTLYIKKETDWDTNNKYSSSISLELPQNGAENRTPDGNGKLTFGDNVGDKIYIAGNFTDDFKYHVDWSTESTKMTVLGSDGIYVFRGVYLKQGDRFKIVDNGSWKGGNFSAVGTQFDIGDMGDIMLFALTTGKYDIVYDSVNNKLTIKAYAAITLSSIELTPPARTEYTVGENLDTAGMSVKAVYSNGYKSVVAPSVCTITGYNKSQTGTQTVTVTYQGKSKTFTVTVDEPQSSYMVTFDSKGGSAVEAQEVDYNGTVTKPADPTRYGYIFGGWFKDEYCTAEWSFDSDKVTSPVTIYAKWTEDESVGYYLHILTQTDPETWGDLDAAINPENSGEVIIDGVQLSVGTKFLAYKGGDWYHAKAEDFTQYGGYDDIITIGVDGDNYIVTTINPAYADAVWKLYIKKEAYANSISVELSKNADESRAADGEGTLTFGERPDDKIFIAGNFTGGFLYHQDWSTDSEAITVLKNNGVYTFRGVYLKKNDAFKIVDNGNWKGGNFVAVGTVLNLDSSRNVTLAALTDGLYDIVYDSVNNKLTINAYVPTATLTSIEVTKQPTKTTYFKGEAFDATGLEITATYSDGSTEVVTTYALSENITAATGTITVTVTYDGETTTFTVIVSQITVTFKDGTTVLDTADVDYNGKVTKPADPTKAGYKFDGWYADNACTDAWDFDTETVTADTTIYSKWTAVYAVTFDADGGSAVAAVEVAHGSKVEKPADPTKDGYVFGGWQLDGEAYDFDTAVTGDIELVAKWNIANGTVLHYSNNGVDNWTDGYTVEKNEDKNEVVIRNVKLYDGMQFLVATNNTYYLKSGMDEAQKFEDVVTVTNEGGNFRIALSDPNYNGSAWTIYLYGLNNDVTVSDNGDLDRNTWVHGMSFVPERNNTLRKADGTTMTANAIENAADAVYIRGNLTGEFGLYNEWSSAENNGNVFVKKSGNTYTFRNVYLKKGDEFKIYLGGTDKWYGGNFEQLDKNIVLSDSGASNIRLGESFVGGFYDIVFTDGTQKTVKIVEYAPATTASIAVTTQPAKTTYYKGEAFSDDGLVITATDTDGNTATVTGYTLSGNNTDTTGTITVTVTYDDKTTTFTITVTQITVTFNVDGGSNVDSMDVDYNGTITAPTAPTKEGYAFGGWTVDGSAYTFGTPITAPITLTATWTVNSYDLTYVYDNGTADSTSQVAFGASVTLAAAPTKDGFIFGGWSDGTTTYNAGASFIMPAGNVTLTAQWGAGSYDLTYVYDNGTADSTSQVAFGASVTLAAAPTKDGFTFGGWSDGTTTYNAGASFTMPAKNVTLTAVWNVQSYTLKYVNGTDESTSQVEYGASVTLNAAPSKTGYAFGGWSDGTTTNNAGATFTMPAHDVTLTAVWNEITYTVCYSVGSGTNGANKATYKITDADFTLVAPTAPATYYFVEWRDKNGDIVTKLDSGIIALADNTNTITLTAVYSNEYTVTFSANGGNLDETTTALKLAYGSTVTKPAKDPTRNSYDFKGWYTTADCTTEWNFATDTVTGNVTVYAGWRQNPKDGTFLYGTMTGWDEDFAKFKAEEWDWGKEWKISGVSLADGAEFVFKSYDAEGNGTGWINPAYNFQQHSHTDIFTVSNENNNFKITYKAGKEAYQSAIWTIFVKKDGSGISFAISGAADTNRKPDGSVGAAFTETGAADVYIMGNFTNGFKQNDDWSSNSTVIDTAKSGNKYYFANVKLMRNDALKIKMGDAWLGLNGDDKLTVTADFEYESSSDGNIVLLTADGYYDVVFDSVAKTLSITAHKNVVVSVKEGAQIFVGTTPDVSKFNVTVDGAAAANFTVIAQPAVAGSNTVTVICGNTIAKATYTSTVVAASSVTVTKNPTKTVYKVGDTLDLAGIEVTVTNNDGSTQKVGATGLTANVTSLTTAGSKTITVTITGTTHTATFTITVNALVVTFESHGGSTVTAVSCDTYNTTITAPTVPTRNGYDFGGWYTDEACTSAWNFATNKVTADITLHAKWINVSGYKLHIFNNGAWTDMDAESHNDDTEIKVTGVRLAVGTKFMAFKGDEWYHPNSTIEQYTYKAPIVTIKSDGDGFIVDSIHADYANVLWTLYIKQDGTGISLEVPANAYENRNTQGNGTLKYSATGPNNTIYIAGTFTDGYKYHQDWSLESTAITVLDERDEFQRVSFRGVYLKKNDAFKIVYNGVWYGGNMKDPLLATGGGISTQPDTDGASAPNIVLPMIEDGFYNIVFSLQSSHWCRLEHYVPTTITSVTVTPPTKTTYLVGETFSSTGMVVTITDSDGNTHNEDYEIIGADTSTSGTKIVTVKYTGGLGGLEANKKATFTITVNKITVTYDSKGGSTVAANTAAIYNKTITVPTAPTKDGYTFADWYKESACQNKWEFDTDKVTGNITLYAKWLRTVTPGTFLHILTDFNAEVEDDKWSDLYSPVSHSNDTEWKIEGVKLQEGTRFLVVTYVANGEHTWYGAKLPQGETQIKQWTYDGIISIVKEGGDFKVASINVGYVDVAWTLYIKKDGTAISLEIPKNADVKRNPGSGDTVSSLTYGNAPATAVYIAGNFTDGFKYHQNWSADSTVMTVVKTKEKADSAFAYTRFEFRHVYLKKGDCFKIVDNGKWWGGDFDATANGFVLSNADGTRDLFVPMLEDGYYDIIYNNSGSHDATHYLRIIPYAPPTIRSVTVTPPTKTTYFVNEPFSTAGMVVTITDSELITHNTEYTITGNTTSSSGTKTVTITYNGSLEAGKNVSLSATFTITVNGITVTYNSDGGSNVPANTTIKYNEAITTQPTTTRAGYTFDGWYNGSTKWVFGANGTKVTGNVTLTAHWTIITYNINYVVSDTTLGTAPAKGTYTVEQAVNLPNPTNIKSGYTFVGWYTETTFTNKVTGIAKGTTGDKTLYAKIAQVVTYTVTFNANGGSAVPQQTVVSGEKATKPAAPSKTGYTFGGWYSNSGLTTAWNFSTAVTANTTLHAKWDVNEYTLTYVYGNGTANSSSQIKYNKAITLPAAPTRTDYTFSGWNDGTTTRNAGASYTMPANAVTMTAQWTANTYSVTFDVNTANGGSGSNTVRTGTAGTAVTAPANPSASNALYAFDGWYTAATGGSKVTTFPAIGTSNVTYWAHYKAVKYRVVLDASNWPEWLSSGPYTYYIHAWGGTSVGTVTGDWGTERPAMTSMGSNKYYYDLSATGITNIIFARNKANDRGTEYMRYEVSVSGLALGNTYTYTATRDNVGFDGYQKVQLNFTGGSSLIFIKAVVGIRYWNCSPADDGNVNAISTLPSTLTAGEYGGINMIYLNNESQYWNQTGDIWWTYSANSVKQYDTNCYGVHYYTIAIDTEDSNGALTRAYN